MLRSLRTSSSAYPIPTSRLHFSTTTNLKNSFEETFNNVISRKTKESDDQPKKRATEVKEDTKSESIEVVSIIPVTATKKVISTQKSSRPNPSKVESRRAPFRIRPQIVRIVEPQIELTAAKITEDIAAIRMPTMNLPYIRRNTQNLEEDKLKAEKKVGHEKLLKTHEAFTRSKKPPTPEEVQDKATDKSLKFKAFRERQSAIQKSKASFSTTSTPSAFVMKDPPLSSTPTLSPVETSRILHNKTRQPYSSPTSETTPIDLPPLSFYSNVLSSSATKFTSIKPNYSYDELEPKIATLAHSLDRVLFNEGVHQLRDENSGVYNFDPNLQLLPKVEEFQFEKLAEYITSSKDDILHKLGQRENRWVGGSTSSVTGMLCQIYFWISKGKEINTSMLSRAWEKAPKGFSVGQRLPVSIVLLEKEGRYSIDGDKTMDSSGEKNILAALGHLMEKLLTTEAQEFKGFLKGSKFPAESSALTPQAYHYTKTGKMILRSQLDAYSPHLPNGSFDVKTRGVVAIRQDRLNHKEAGGYLIRSLQGITESYEKEFYDLIRSAFLKYSFQARIGMMDGIFLCYHNCARIFGFEYLKIAKMDEALFGSEMEGKMVYSLTVGILEKVLEEGRDSYPGRSVKMMFEAIDDKLLVFVEPFTATVEDIPVVILKLTGNNYVNTVATEQVDILKTFEETGKPVNWSVGYDIIREDGTGVLSRPEIQKKFDATRSRQLLFDTIYLPSSVSAKSIKNAHRIVAEAENPNSIIDDTLPPSDPSSLPPVTPPTRAEMRDSAALTAEYPPLNGIRYISKIHAGLNRLRSQSRAGAIDIEKQLKSDKKNGISFWTGKKVVHRNIQNEKVE